METSTLRYSNHGFNIRRIRERRRIKQEALADKIGISQSTLSNYENREYLDDEILDKIAKGLEVPVEVIKEAMEDADIMINNGSLHDNAIAFQKNYYPSFNPIDKIVELYDEKIALYERLLKTEQEKVAMLERTIEKLAVKK